jgi:uroporphyrin-III C-methyltransferase/precorrin-2 dehydrogenase/sirohydrochlorin ferrochelatase
MDYLPIFIRLQGQPAVVVGGGRVGLRKVELLRKAGARVTVVAPEITEELVALRDSGELRHVAAPFESTHLEGAELVIAATHSRDVNRSVSEAARALRLPVNVVDDPELSTFIFPAIIDRSPVIVAVGSGGQSPVLARRVREQLEALLPARLGALARFVGNRRKEVQQVLPPRERRPFWERIIGGIVGSRVLAGDEASVGEAFASELKGSRPAGEVYLIGAGPGDPDRLVSDAVLERARRDAERVFVGKEAGAHHMTQERIHELMVHYARQGLRVARLKGGDPFVFGRGGEEIEVLQAHGIPYVVVPGITAALGAAAAAGIPLTHRKYAQSVTLTAGHALDDESLDWPSLAHPHHTVVFYMGVAQLPRIVSKLIAAGAPADHPVAIVERATLAEQRIVRATLCSIESVANAARVVSPALLIVGRVAALARADLGIGAVGGDEALRSPNEWAARESA